MYIVKCNKYFTKYHIIPNDTAGNEISIKYSTPFVDTKDLKENEYSLKYKYGY